MSNTYRNKSVQFQAMQWTGSNTDELAAFIGFPSAGNFSTDFRGIDPMDGCYKFNCPTGGLVIINKGDWVRAWDGGFYPLPDAIFQSNYELV